MGALRIQHTQPLEGSFSVSQGEQDAHAVSRIQKIVNNTSLSPLPGEAAPLTGRLTQKEPLTKAEVSYLTKLRALMAILIKQSNDITQRESEQMRTLKKEIQAESNVSAGLTEKFGRNNFLWSLLSFVPQLLPMLPNSNDTDKNIAKLLSDQIVPKFGEMFGAGTQASMKKVDNHVQVGLTEMNTNSNNTQTNTAYKNQIEEALKLLDNVLREASRAGY